MSSDDLAARRARHHPGLHARCFECRGAWPCDAEVLGAALEAERQARPAAEAAPRPQAHLRRPCLCCAPPADRD